METKFHLVAVGQHFEWDGKRYVKSTPLLATQVPEGGQKFMPRAALVKVVGSEGAPAPTVEKPAMLDSTTVRGAIERYHQRCVKLCEACAQQPGDDIAQLHSELAQNYRELLAELKL